MLEGVQVGRKFGGLRALTDLDFTVEKGRIVGLIGPNGSGKTTLFNVITGFYPADSGRVIFKGKEITRSKPHEIARLGIARTFQIVRPLLGLSVLDNVTAAFLYGRENIKSMAKGRERADELLKFMRLEKWRNAPAQRLLAADRKRLEVARALAVRPEILLLDEVFSGLNDKEIEDSIKLVFRIRDELGITIFLIEHVMKAIMGMCEKLCVIHYGVKLAEGTPGRSVAQSGGDRSISGEEETVLKIENLSVAYSGEAVLHDLSLTVSEGEIVSVVGANGGGKTTLLRTISGLMKPALGAIRFMGERIDGLAPHEICARGLIQVPEGRQLFPKMSVVANLEMGAYLSKARKNAAQSLSRVYDLFPILTERTRQKAGLMSGGEQQMLAIGRALMSIPRLLMLDEPSEGLSPLLTSTVFDVFKP